VAAIPPQTFLLYMYVVSVHKKTISYSKSAKLVYITGAFDFVYTLSASTSGLVRRFTSAED